MRTVAIVGVGLIGASFGLALRKAGFRGRILGVSSPDATRDALAVGAIDEGLSVEAAIPQADLVYLSQTIRRIVATIGRLDEWLKPGALVTDAGSTKVEIVACARAAIRRTQFLGGHPLAGKETRGAASADADLFRGRTYVLTPSETSDLETPIAREFIEWLGAIGARTLTLAPAEHDRIVGFTSHLPQLASTALATLLARKLTAEREAMVSGPGLADMTRLAVSSYDVWSDILATNTQVVDLALADYIAELEALRATLNSERTSDSFERAAAFSRRLRSSSPPDPNA
jgi:prephenate dehydrogenase